MAALLATPHCIKRNRHRWRRAASGRRDYNYFRDYEPGTGRYIESDPIGLRAGVSTYGYVRGNPMRYDDPQGLFSIDKSCEGCDDFRSTLEKELRWACDMFAMSMTPENRYAKCLAKRCKRGKVRCTSTSGQCDGTTLAFAKLGWGKTANLCVPKMYSHEPRHYGAIVIHEWAHTCGWDHGSGDEPKWDPDGFDGVPGGGDGRMRDPWY